MHLKGMTQHEEKPPEASSKVGDWNAPSLPPSTYHRLEEMTLPEGPFRAPKSGTERQKQKHMNRSRNITNV